MLQWNARFVVLLVALALIAEVVGRAGSGTNFQW
jgi:hypothetical protein